MEQYILVSRAFDLLNNEWLLRYGFNKKLKITKAQFNRLKVLVNEVKADNLKNIAELESLVSSLRFKIKLETECLSARSSMGHSYYTQKKGYHNQLRAETQNTLDSMRGISGLEYNYKNLQNNFDNYKKVWSYEATQKLLEALKLAKTTIIKRDGIYDLFKDGKRWG